MLNSHQTQQSQGEENQIELADIIPELPVDDIRPAAEADMKPRESEFTMGEITDEESARLSCKGTM